MKRSLFLFIFVLFFSSCHVARFFIYNVADIHDYKKFPKEAISKPAVPFLFTEVGATPPYFKMPSVITIKKKKYNFDQLLHKTRTVAFLIIRNDSMLYEHYLSQYDKGSIVPSFSAAKSFVSALMGIAIDEGFIKNVQEPITKYLPELPKNKGFENITIENVLDMQSGIRFNEGYLNPFGEVAKYYYGTNIRKYIGQLRVKEAPGKQFEYKSVNTELLALIIEHATGKPLYTYMQEKIWQQTGMEYDASWSVDSRKHKTVKAFCCLNARARDFAKFGRLFLNNGSWNGKQVISEKWVKQSTQFDRAKNGFAYSYQWWHNPDISVLKDSTLLTGVYSKQPIKTTDGKTIEAIARPGKDFFANGLLGQFIYVYPEKKIIIVRLGKKLGGMDWPQLFRAIAENN